MQELTAAQQAELESKMKQSGISRNNITDKDEIIAAAKEKLKDEYSILDLTGRQLYTIRDMTHF